MDVKIKDAPLVPTMSDSHKMAASNGTNQPVAISVGQLDAYIKIEARNVYGVQPFNQGTSYDVKQKVIYSNKMYRFTAPHNAGDAWDASIVEEVTIMSLIAEGTLNLTALIEALNNTKADKDGAYKSLTAGMTYGIVPLQSDSVKETGASFIGRTTAGNTTIPEQGVTTVEKIVGAWDNTLKKCFNPTLGMLSLGGNWFRPSKVLNGVKLNSTGAVVADAAYKIAIVPCVACKTGTDKNNGIKVEFGTGYTDNTIGYVGYSAVAPAAVGDETTILTANSYGAYLPAAVGYMAISVKSTDKLYVHPRWSGYMDGVYVEPSEDEITFSAIEWGLSDLDYIERISDTSANLHRGRGRVVLADLVWSVTSAESEGVTTYTFTAPLPADAATGGSLKSDYEGVSITSNVFVITSTTITTVADLKTALGESFGLYELATATDTEIQQTLSLANSDFGGEFFLGAAVAPASCDFAYGVSYVGYIRDHQKMLEVMNVVLAAALAECIGRLDSMEKLLSDGFDTLKTKHLVVTRTANLPS